MRMRLFYTTLFTCLMTQLFGFQNKDESLFAKLESVHTNITFNNELQDVKEANIMIYSNFYGGAGVGIGDVNNDGLPDVYFAGNQVADRLYLNQGNMEFTDATQTSGIKDNGGWSSGVIMADVNQDGWLDIYVTRELYDEEPVLRRNFYYMNDGDGTFTERGEEYGISNTERTRHATFLDYDNDGDLDLFLLNQPPNPGDYSKFYRTNLLQPEYRPVLYRNDGSSFKDVSTEAGFTKTGFPNSVTASDLNGDGWTDLFVANDFWVGDWYYINNGDGTFTDMALEKLSHTSFSSMGVDAADIDNDGRLDIGVVDMVAEDNFRQKANMSGMNPAAFWKVVDEGGGHQYMFNMLHHNDGDAYFSDIAQLAGIASTDWSWSILLADLDNDGWKDIHITNGLMRDIRNKDASKTLPDFLEAALHEFVQKHPDPDNVGIWDIVDINEALALVPSERLSNYTFKNNGDLTFTNVSEKWGLGDRTFSNGSAYADLDNDGDLDLIVNNINDPASVYENRTVDKKAGNYIRIVIANDAPLTTIDGVKVFLKNNDEEQFQEITGVRGMYSTSEKVAHFGLGDRANVEEIMVEWRDGRVNRFMNVGANQVLTARYSESATLALKENDKTLPIFTKVHMQGLSDYVHQENDFDDYKMQVLLPHKMSTYGPHITVGAVDNDGREDLFIGGSATNPAAVFSQKNTHFSQSSQPGLSADSIQEDLGSLLFDADGDGDDDLYVVSGGNEFRPGSDKYQDRLYMNENGTWVKAEGALPNLRSSGSVVRAEDIDGDGDLDLFVGGRHKTWSYPEPVTSYILLNEGGAFRDATAQVAPDLLSIGMVNDAVWSDQNGDGRSDLVLVGEWMPITVLLNENGILTEQEGYSLGKSAGWWFSVDASDLDGDGDEDIVAGNLGLNYKYKASEEEPFGVYYYDFDENGKKDIVLTYYNFGIEYPLRGKQCSSEQVPEISDKFETYNLFASSDVADVYGASSLDSALHYEAYTFASTVFINEGNGSYEARELPVQAQVSSVNDLLIQDFNGDSHLDILLAGNLYNAEVETARNDAGHGLLLLGDGDGGFTSMDSEESGFFVPYDVKDLEVLNVGGEAYIIVGCNNEAIQVFKHNLR